MLVKDERPRKKMKREPRACVSQQREKTESKQGRGGKQDPGFVLFCFEVDRYGSTTTVEWQNLAHERMRV